MPDSQLRILFVDDKEKHVTEATTALKRQLQECGIEVEVVPKTTVADALKVLRTERFHVAVVDLRFQGGSGPDGNEILNQILDEKILPIIVYTGYIEDLDEKFKGHGLIAIVKTKKIRDVAEKIKEWHNDSILYFFSEDGFIGSTLHKTLLLTMWDNVSKYWEYLEKGDIETLSRTAGRIAATLFYDVLASEPEFASEAGEVCIHHGEIYIFKTPRNYLAVGDLIREEDGLYIVITPSCDLVPRSGGGSKAKDILLARCADLSDFAKQHTELRDAMKALHDPSTDGRNREDAIKWVERMMRHATLNDDGRKFFLPPFAKFRGGVVDLLLLKMRPYGQEERAELIKKRELSLNRDVAAELSARFARYMIRLGQASYQTNPLIEAVKGTLDADGSDKKPS